MDPIQLGQYAWSHLLKLEEIVMLVRPERDLDGHVAELAGIHVLGEQQARLAGQHVQVAERLQVKAVVIRVDGKVGIECAEHECYAQRVRFQRVSTAAHEEQGEGHANRHLTSVGHVRQIRSHTRLKVSTYTEHFQVTGAGHHHR